MYPRTGHVYTLREIYNMSELRDSPCLLFNHDGKQGVIQQGHVLVTEFLSVPGIGDTCWTFIRETHEWVPVFMFHSADKPITEYLDLETDLLEMRWWWATPKGFKREQFVGE
jgi:hypothetical protein